MKYKEWLISWLENYVQPSSKQRTFARYSEIVNQHIIPKLGEADITELKPFVLQCYVKELLNNGNLKNNNGLSPNSVNAIITVIQNSLRTAYGLGYVDSYIADKIKRPKIEEREITSFTTVEQKKIEQAVLKHKKIKMFGILLCLYTGLRIGELLALEWTDIDFVKCELSVNKTCYDGKNPDGSFCRITDKPKTQTSQRIIPLPKQLLSLLRDIRKKSGSKYVVSNGDKIICIRSYQKTFSSLLKKLDISHKGFHAIRHTFATRALECGMDVKTLSEILGHKNPTTTLNRYVHSLMEHKREMMNKIGKLL